jgi:Tol biopolymer transport system component
VYAAGPSADGGTDLWLVDVTAGTERLLVGGSGDQFAPVWSPDGAWIAYLDEPAGAGTRVTVIRANGLDRLAITELGGWTYPQWSPDAKSVIATDAQLGQAPTLEILDPTGRNPARAFALPDVDGMGRSDQSSWQRVP